MSISSNKYVDKVADDARVLPIWVRGNFQNLEIVVRVEHERIPWDCDIANVGEIVIGWVSEFSSDGSNETACRYHAKDDLYATHGQF
jgi:hypothetical protein